MNFQLLLVAVAAFVINSVSSMCMQPRVRKSWDALTAAERETYVSAVEIAMDRGYHIKFAEIHANGQSEQEAHATCGFMLWHRRFLLAYENMLRSLGPEYECVTIPYWDYFADYQKYQNGLCNNMESCSTILNGLGGSSGNFRRQRIVSSRPSGQCNAGRPNNHFCQNSGRSGSRCRQCLVRGDYSRSRFPSGLGYASLVDSILDANSYSDINRNVQNGFHNAMHNALGGAMRTMASPSDILFYSHHATVDMMHYLYYSCRVGRVLSLEEKRNSPLAFSCESGGLTPDSDIKMHWNHRGQYEAFAHNHEDLKPFFERLGTQYKDFTDTYDLDPFMRYAYQADELAEQMFRDDRVCPVAQRRRLQEDNIIIPKTVFDSVLGTNVSRETIQVEKKAVKDFNKVRAQLEIANKDASPTEIVEIAEVMECIKYEKDHGRIQDYSKEFRRGFKIPREQKPRCLMLFDKFDLRNKKGRSSSKLTVK